MTNTLELIVPLVVVATPEDVDVVEAVELMLADPTLAEPIVDVKLLAELTEDVRPFVDVVIAVKLFYGQDLKLQTVQSLFYKRIYTIKASFILHKSHKQHNNK